MSTALPISRIAETARLSERQLERLFRRDLKTMPHAYRAQFGISPSRDRADT